MAFPFHYMTLAIDKLNGHGLSNAVLATEVPGNSNKSERFSNKGEWANLY